ncbi:uncharacterized protein Z518_03081 [Rhinocladiella mackenziei CBS 650.93]|uniref:Spindle pole body component n=1 Tax=Rhinocladiella mackenziei CBS 650.93 TaxID=1442369 RepID=A0A0D2JGG3_9EURO|nr:uncharacterized protein Z518_03081 [Rhinocladiella mackenziei CBS 650.93]KIX08425.1 hypothetical protein Z518_03081 [Rhinocladiella mackenziei CBS 650.93]
MLHEILLSLSGLQSPIWIQEKQSEGGDENGFNQYVSPPERAMLETLAHLHDLHVRIKGATTKSSTGHWSMVCRAVSASIADVHLGRFMDKIIQVESAILKKDAGYVGAYEIVPLSTIVTEFAPWTRRLEWIWFVVQHLDPELKHAKGTHRPSSASILDLLEHETHTGYSDIEDMAIDLLTVAQRAWMRAVSLWVLYGKLPTSGAEDFLVKPNPHLLSTTDAFLVDPSLQPNFVNAGASNALLMIGSALNQLNSQSLSVASTLQGSSNPTILLLPRHLGLLESLRYPLNSSLLENVLSTINQSISENALSQILPRPLVMQLLQVILRYVLLDHGEFTVSLVAHADERITNRQQTQTAARPVRNIGRLDDLAIKDAEINGILSKTMAELVALRGDEDGEDDVFHFAKKILSLKTVDVQHGQQMIATLLPTPTLLYITIPPSSPLHIFLSSQDIQTYALINAYLLSIRRADLHLSALWKLTSQRRCHPSPLGPPRSASRVGQAKLAARRSREDRRAKRTRRYWICASKAVFVTNELEAYLQGEVIQSSWTHFRKWIDGGDKGILSAKSSRPCTASTGDQMKMTEVSHGTYDASGSGGRSQPSDPRTLAEAHRAYLRALNAALFITNDDWMTMLKDLLNQIDHFIALFSRLQTVWEGLDLQEDDGVVDAFSNYAQNEKEVLTEMDRTSDAIEGTLVGLVNKIRDMEKEKRTGVGMDNVVQRLSDVELNGSKFVPWQARTVDRLVMKLDSLAGRQEERIGIEIAEGYDDE